MTVFYHILGYLLQLFALSSSSIFHGSKKDINTGPIPPFHINEDLTISTCL